MVINVSSIVLLHRVLTEDTKKLRAFNNASPFLVKFLWVSELYKNSSCNSGDFCAKSEKASPKAYWKIEIDDKSVLIVIFYVNYERDK